MANGMPAHLDMHWEMMCIDTLADTLNSGIFRQNEENDNGKIENEIHLQIFLL